MSASKATTKVGIPLPTTQQQRRERDSTVSNHHLLRSIHILTCFTGNIKKQEYKVLAYFGATLWSISVCVNLFFAFYESFPKLGAMGVIICVVFLLNCVICTLGVNLRCVAWIERGVGALSNHNFRRTIKETNSIGKVRQLGERKERERERRERKERESLKVYVNPSRNYRRGVGSGGAGEASAPATF